MAGNTWEIRALEFANCNCSYGCPCQFNGLPTHGDCRAVLGFDIRQGFHGATRLDGLKACTIFSWPGAVHQGNGEAVFIIEKRATEAQKAALLRIFSGKDTEPGATIFNVFSGTLKTVHEPIFSDIEFEVDIDARRARLKVPGQVEGRGEPILNPVTRKEHRVRIDMPNGFEYSLAEIGRGWSKSSAPVAMELADSYGQFCHVDLCQSGVIR